MAKTQHGRDLTGAEMAVMLDEFANGQPTREVTAFVEQITMRTHRTLQQKIMGLFVACIETWAEDKGGHDGRNEATVKLAKKMIDGTGDKYDRGLPYI
jgi:hypothetical protein